MTPGRAPEPKRQAKTLAEAGISIIVPPAPTALTLADLGEPVRLDLSAMRKTWRSPQEGGRDA